MREREAREMSKRSGTTLLPFLFLCVLLSWTRGWALEDENSDEKEHRFALPQEAFNAKHRRESSESGGTKVKWTAGDNSGKHASAPRSQRYWDEHGLGALQHGVLAGCSLAQPPVVSTQTVNAEVTSSTVMHPTLLRG